MNHLYPRLRKEHAERHARAWSQRQDLAPVPFAIPVEEVEYGATGGERVPEQELRNLTDGIRKMAADCGYPSRHDEKDKRRFDLEVTRLLINSMQISPHEGAIPGVWNTLTCVLLPDVVAWRFPKRDGDGPRALERFVSQVRNCFGRLWRRGLLLLDRAAADPFHLVAALSEDQFLHLIERPHLAGNRRLAVLIARTCVNLQTPRRDQIMENAAKRLRRLASVLSFETMPDATLAQVVKQAFAESEQVVLGTATQVK